MAGKQRAGKGARLQIGGTNLNAKTANVTERGDDLDTTNFEAQGFETGTIGVQVCEQEIESDWDAGRNYYDNPPGIYPRDDLANVVIYENVNDGRFWSFPTSRVLSSRNIISVRPLVGFNWSGKSNGTYTRPTGSN